MKNSNKNTTAFFALLRAGLWEEDVRLSEYGEIDYSEVYRLASEQSVVGLIAAGFEHVKDVKIPQDIALTIAGEVLQLEQRNVAMNAFISELIEEMRNSDIYALLVKGQGVAQCYERPLWRASGDVDFLLSDTNYKKARTVLSAFASNVEAEHLKTMHQAMRFGQWEVELHGTLRSKLGRRIDKGIERIQNEVFCGGSVRSWMNGHTQVFIPRADEDVIFVFTHILQHFFNGGIGLRQVCDWCRLLWTYKDSLDIKLLERRLKSMRLMSEWRAYAALVVEWLGMPIEAMPLYSPDERWKRKGDKVLNYIMRVGNMGHSRDWSFREKYSAPVRKIATLSRVTGDAMIQFAIFPLDAIRVWWLIVTKGLSEAV